MSETVFSKIVAGEIPNHTVYEDDHVLAFLDINPHAKGHTVVIPKKAVATLSEMSLEDYQLLSQGLFGAIKRVKEVLKPDALNIGINDGKASGQAVPHVHWHIIPRWQDDGGGSMHSIVKNPGEMPVTEVAKLFSS